MNEFQSRASRNCSNLNKEMIAIIIFIHTCDMDKALYLIIMKYIFEIVRIDIKVAVK